MSSCKMMKLEQSFELSGGPRLCRCSVFVVHKVTILKDEIRSKKYHSLAEKVPTIPSTSTTFTTFLVGHFWRLAHPTRNTAVCYVVSSTTHSAEIPPAAIAQYTLTHLLGWSEIFYLLNYIDHIYLRRINRFSQTYFIVEQYSVNRLV